LIRSFLLLAIFIAMTLLMGFIASHGNTRAVLLGVSALSIFVVAFIRTEWSIYILIFSMLLSPEITAGDVQGRATTIRGGVTLRLEDFLLVVIGLSWFAKNAVHKELGLFLKTPLNRPIVFYIAACLISTGFGIITGRVSPATGFLFVVKYIEYFLVFFMVVNHLESPEQVKRFVICMFFTCIVISFIGMAQIPAGNRVTAPFEGETGEPNTLGGYLVFMGAVAAGLYLKIDHKKLKLWLITLIILIVPAFLYTRSRGSYLALMPVLLFLVSQTRRKALAMSFLMVSFALTPVLLPSVVKERILFTFTQIPHPGQQIRIGNVTLDTSTTARLDSWRNAFLDWTHRPLLGYGVTGYQFVDAQFPRILAETGLLGLIAFLYLLLSVFRMIYDNMQKLQNVYFKGLTFGFLAGYIGLLFHAIGANTFIIVRIMEPFWLMAGIVAVLPTLDKKETVHSTTGRQQRFIAIS